MVQDVVNSGWEQREEFHVFSIDNQVKALPFSLRIACSQTES